MQTEYPIKSFKNSEQWRQWLSKNGTTQNGIWLKIYKKDSNIASITYAEALEEALCFGWIDGQKKSYDELAFLQKFTPRRKRSLWSKRNIELVAKLTKEGRMAGSGLQEVKLAKSDGRWEAAYDKPSEMTIPDFFMKELRKRPKAMKFFKTLKKADTFAIGWRLQTAKTEKGKQKRMDKIIELLETGKSLH